MVRIRFLLIGALCVLLSPLALQAQQFTITNQQLVSSVRASLYQYDYTYQITAENTGPDVATVACVVTSTTSQTIIESGNLSFGDMPSGSTATSTTTLVLRQDRRYPFSWSNLQWQWSSAALIVGSPVIYPVSVFVGDTTLVTVTSQITSGPTGPPLAAGGATLLQVDQNNQVIATLGTMNDAGAYGDEIAGDQIYTVQFTTSPTATGQMRLRVSAQFQGMPVATFSGIATLPIGPQPPTAQTIGPDGGTFNFPHGLVLEVPAGAVSAPAILHIEDVPADQANAILATGNGGSPSKRFLGGFTTPDNIQFAVPVMATFPVLPLQFQEIPVAADIDLVGQGYSLTTNPVTFHGTYSTADIEIRQSDPPAVVGAMPNLSANGCLPGESADSCSNRKINCTQSCLLNADPSQNCSSFADPLEPACCEVSYYSECAGGCSCCKDNVVRSIVKSNSTESSGTTYDCSINSEQIQTTFPDCPGSPSYVDNVTELSDGCPKDLNVTVTINPPTPTVYSCAPPITVTGSITGTSASTGKTIPFLASVLDWTSTGELVLAPMTPAGVSGSTVNLHAIQSGNLGTLTATLGTSEFTTTVPVQINKATATVTPTQQTLLGPQGQFTPVASIDHNVCSPCLMNWSSDNSSVATVDPNSGLVTAVNGGTATISGVLNDKTSLTTSDCQENYAVSLPVTVCSMTGTWQGEFSGETISCAVQTSEGCATWGQPIPISGPVTVASTQNGTSVSAVISLSADPVEGTFTGTNINGNVSVEGMLPCHVPCPTSADPSAMCPAECPAGLSGTLSSDCSTFSGSLYDDRPRTVTGTISLQRTAP